MFNRVVVAVDLSETCQRVFDEAVQLAKRYDAKLMLFHVLSTEEELYPPYSLYPLMSYYSEFTEKALENYENRIKDLETRSLAQLKGLQRKAIAAGVDVEIGQVIGGAGHCICDIAKKWEADLILIGNHGRTGWGEMILGSVSNYVMHHAPCSVLVIRASQVQADQPAEESAHEAVKAERTVKL